MKKMLLIVLTAVLLVASLPMTVLAHDVPDLTQNGTITLTVAFDEKPLNGGELELHLVGNIKEDDGNYSFVLAADFGGKTMTEADLNDPALAIDLAKDITNTTPAATAKIKEGKAVFNNVNPGLYLVCQKTATPGFAAMNPFLLSMPNFVGGKYVTDITAEPKVGLETLPPTAPSVTQPALPQTGQLNWPIPVLAVLGLALVVVGIVLKTRKKATYEG